MTMTNDTLTSFDPRDPRMSVDPYPIYRQLRETDPVHWVEAARMWVVTSYREIMEICTEDEVFHHQYERREIMREGEQVRGQAYFNAIRRMVFMMDGDDHRRVRPLFASWFFDPVKMRGLTPVIERVANDLMDELADRREIDVVRDYAYQLPLRVIGELLGIPDEDHAGVAEAIEAIVPLAEGSVPKTQAVLDAGNGAVTHLADYFGRLIEARRKRPSDDLLSSMIQAADAGGIL